MRGIHIFGKLCYAEMHAMREPLVQKPRRNCQKAFKTFSEKPIQIVYEF